MRLRKCQTNNVHQQSPGAAVLPPKSSYSLSQHLVLISSFLLGKLLLTPAPLPFTTAVCCLMCCSSFFSRRDLSKHGNTVPVALYSLALLFPVSSIIAHFCQKQVQTQGAKRGHAVALPLLMCTRWGTCHVGVWHCPTLACTLAGIYGISSLLMSHHITHLTQCRSSRVLWGELRVW